MSIAMKTEKACSGLVQVTNVTWTKMSRGGDLARVRSAVPVVYPSEPHPIEEGNLSIIIRNWREHNEFKTPGERQDSHILLTPFQIGCAEISTSTNSLRLRFHYSQDSCGAPDRSYLNWSADESATTGKTITVHPGEWVQLRYNGRFTDVDSGMWWYEETTINLACVVNTPAKNVFFSQQPKHQLQFLAELW